MKIIFVNICMQHNYVDIQHNYFNMRLKLHVSLVIFLYVDMNKSHMYMIMLYVDIYIHFLIQIGGGIYFKICAAYSLYSTYVPFKVLINLMRICQDCTTSSFSKHFLYH